MARCTCGCRDVSRCRDMSWEVGPCLLDGPGDGSDGADTTLGGQLDTLWTRLVDGSRMCPMVWTHHWRSWGRAMSGELRLSGMPAVPDGLGAIRLASNASGDVRCTLGTQGCVPGWWTMVKGPNDVRHIWGHARGHGLTIWCVRGVLWAHRCVTGAVTHHEAGNMAGDVFPGGGPWVGVQMTCPGGRTHHSTC